MPEEELYHPAHLVPRKHFDSLAAGRGGRDEIRLLIEGERSRRLLLLRALLDAAVGQPDAQGPLPDMESIWNTLIILQGRAPAQLDSILMQPQIGMWIAHCLRRLHGTASSRFPLWVDIGYINNMMIAVAARAGVAWHCAVPHQAGTVMFPTLGLVMLPGTDQYGIAEASVSASHIRLRTRQNSIDVRFRCDSDSDSGSWQRLRQIRSGRGELAVWLDDIDPYREIGEPFPPDRLSDPEARYWQDLLDDAAALLADDDPQLVEAMSAGLMSIVPISRAPVVPVRSASSGDSFGSALISTPPDAITLAVTLVHEFQHIKLGGLLHLVTLHEDTGDATLYAPWRDDPRPLSGLLQGAYAFLGVTNFWRIRRHCEHSGPNRDLAEFEFALWRDETWRTLRVLRNDRRLTAHGRRFVEGMAGQLASWRAEPVPSAIAAAAKGAAADHYIGWRIRHVRPDPDYVDAVARGLDHGYPATLGPPPSPVIEPDLDAPWSHRRVTLTRLRLTDPEAFRRLGERGGSGAASPDADLAWVSGDLGGAAAAYAEQVVTNPDQPDAWTGLILTLGPDGLAGLRLASQPELLPAVYRVLHSGQAAVDPGLIARRLCGLTLPELRRAAHMGIEAMSHSARFPLTAAVVAG